MYVCVCMYVCMYVSNRKTILGSCIKWVYFAKPLRSMGSEVYPISEKLPRYMALSTPDFEVWVAKYAPYLKLMHEPSIVYLYGVAPLGAAENQILDIFRII